MTTNPSSAPSPEDNERAAKHDEFLGKLFLAVYLLVLGGIGVALFSWLNTDQDLFPVSNGDPEQVIADGINHSGKAEYLGSQRGYREAIPTSVSVKDAHTGVILSCNVIKTTQDGLDNAAVFCTPGQPATFVIPLTHHRNMFS